MVDGAKMAQPILIAAPENMHEHDQVRERLAQFSDAGREAVLIWTPEAETSAARGALLEAAAQHAERGKLAILLSSEVTVPPSLLSAQILHRHEFFGAIPAISPTAPEMTEYNTLSADVAPPPLSSEKTIPATSEFISAFMAEENPVTEALAEAVLSVDPAPAEPDFAAETAIPATAIDDRGDIQRLAERNLGDLVADSMPDTIPTANAPGTQEVPASSIAAASSPKQAGHFLSPDSGMNLSQPDHPPKTESTRVDTPTPVTAPNAAAASTWPNLAASVAAHSTGSGARPMEAPMLPPRASTDGNAKPGLAASKMQNARSARGWEPLRIGVALVAIIGSGALLFNAMQRGTPGNDTALAEAGSLPPPPAGITAVPALTPDAVSLPAAALEIIPEAEPENSGSVSAEFSSSPIAPDSGPRPAATAPGAPPANNSFNTTFAENGSVPLVNAGPPSSAARISPDGVVLSGEGPGRGAIRIASVPAAAAPDASALDAAITEAEQTLAVLEQQFWPPPEVLDAEAQTLLARRWELKQRIGDLQEQRRRWNSFGRGRL